MNKTVWVIARYILIIASAIVATEGTLNEEVIRAVLGAASGLAAAVWGVYVNWGTKSVPVEAVVVHDLPVVSPVTGRTLPPPSAEPWKSKEG